MTQSKDEFTINLDELELGDLLSDDTITINLDDTYGTTTTYWAGDSVTDVVYSGSNDGTFTIDTTASAVGLDWVYERHSLSISEVESMCKEYPALEKTWRNFKSMYDMVRQDYQGKKDAGELDDDIPF